MTLREALADYLRLRRRLGFEMPQDGRLLEGFVKFLERAGAERITTDLALEWARMPAGAHPHYWRQRLSVVRGFARHLATIDPASEVPSKDLLPGHRPRIAPYIYTEQEITALMAAAGRLTPALRAVRHQTLIGLLAVTGMRPGRRSRLTARMSISGTAWCTSAPASRRNSARCRCTTARSARLASMPGCATLASPNRRRRRSSLAREVGGCRVGSSTGRSPSWSARSASMAAARAPDPSARSPPCPGRAHAPGLASRRG